MIHTGKGRNTTIDLYWNEGNYIWNNTGDTARLQTPANKVVEVADTCANETVSGRAHVAC